jgi:hypothetical protein
MFRHNVVFFSVGADDVTAEEGDHHRGDADDLDLGEKSRWLSGWLTSRWPNGDDTKLLDKFLT